MDIEEGFEEKEVEEKGKVKVDKEKKQLEME